MWQGDVLFATFLALPRGGDVSPIVVPALGYPRFASHGTPEYY